MSLKGRTLFITGGSRGIGLAIALRAARDGANVAIAAKTADAASETARARSTSAADDIANAGGKALPLAVDIRDEAAVIAAMEADGRRRFGGIDIVRQQCQRHQPDAGRKTDMKRFDLMHQVNTRGTFMVSKYRHSASGEVVKIRTS